MKHEIFKVPNLIVPNECGRSLEGLFMVAQLWNKNRNEDIIAKINNADARIEKIKRVVLITALMIWSAFVSSLLTFSALSKIPSPIVCGIWICLCLGSVVGNLYVKYRKLQTPLELLDFYRLIRVLTHVVSESPFGICGDNSAWFSITKIKAAAEIFAKARMADLKTAEDALDLRIKDGADIETVENLGKNLVRLRSKIFGEMGLLASANLISRNKSEYAYKP